MRLLLNSIGLACDIAAGLMLWKYGLPESINREGASFLQLNREDEEMKTRAKHYDRFARVGIVLLILGFTLQLVSNFV